MTDTQAPEVTETTLPASEDPKTLELVRQGMEQVVKGKMDLSDLFQTVVAKEDPKVPDLKPPVPPKLTEAQKDALKRLPDVYGKTVVTAVRKLAPAQKAALVEEREVIDEVLGVLEKRKSESIREVLANHMDQILTDEEKEGARHDKKGHVALKHEDPVEGTGKKIQRSVSGGKPRLTIEHVEALHREGLVDRKTYLALTKKPDLPRVLDEEGLHKAIQKDPALFFLLGSRAEPTVPTTTIKVVDDK